MNLHAWVVMSNHIHLIISSDTNKIENIVRDFKKFTSKKIITAVIENPTESRKEWMINMFTMPVPTALWGLDPKIKIILSFNFGNRIIIPSAYQLQRC